MTDREVYTYYGNTFLLVPDPLRDATMIAKMMSSPSFREFEPVFRDEPSTTREEAEKRIRGHLKDDDVIRLHIADEEHQPFGSIILRLNPDDETRAEIGIAVIKQRESRGHATEAIKAICRYGYQERGRTLIEIYVIPENSRAIAVYERCGFRGESIQSIEGEDKVQRNYRYMTLTMTDEVIADWST